MLRVTAMPAVSFSLTKKAVIDPILTLRAPLPPLKPEQVVSWTATVWQVVQSEVVTRVVAIFASVFAAADASVHFLTGMYKGACLLTRSICCLNSLSYSKSAIYVHFWQAAWFSGLATIGSVAGFVWPSILQRCVYSPLTPIYYSLETSNPISNKLFGFNNSGIAGQVNGVYITTNESNLEKTQQVLNQQPRPNTNTIHIGCATWYNLDIMCTRKSTFGLIIDFNPKNAKFIRKTIEIINSCDSRDSFKKAMINYLNSLSGEERSIFFHRDQQGSPTDRIELELSREGSWLQSEKSYLYIKKLASQNRLIPITEDIRNCKKISEIRSFLNDNGIVIDTLYMSNICNFMNNSNDRISFMKSIKQLLDMRSIFINCPKIRLSNDSEVTILSQRAVLGKEVLKSKDNTMNFFEEVQLGA